MVVLCFAVAATASADDGILRGSCGKDVAYAFNTKTKELVISGTGPMYDYSRYEDQPFSLIDINTVVIKNGVTTIGNCVFYECSLTSIEIPDTVTSIGEYAFYESDLESVVIPDSVTYVGANAFYLCVQLNDVTLGNGLTELSSGVFSHCSSIKSIIIPDSVIKLGNQAFYCCSALNNVTIPISVKTIGQSAFLESDLKYIYYTGSESQWNMINIDNYYNGAIKNAKKFYDYHIHLYNETVTSSTCTAQGYTTYTCACGDTYVADYTDKLNHEYTSEITTPATHLKEGVETFTCKCGDSYTEPVTKLVEHTYTSEVTKEATHLAEGETTYTCECGDTYTEVIAKLTAHAYDKTVTEPTCTEKGYTIYTCECGDTYTEEIAAVGHKELVIPSVEATCTDEGLSAGKVCEACGEELASQQIIPAKGHKFSSWIVISEVTCDTNGRKVRICACGAVEEDIENSFGHSDADNDNKCDSCNEALKKEVNMPAEKDNVFTFLKSFLNNLIEFFRQLLGIKK